VPIIGCKCPVCTSADERDKRLRASVYVEYEGLKILVDAGPDFRQQMLREDICHLDAILLTHQHKDHTGGLDDVRALNFIEKRAFPIYCEPRVQESLKMEYSYAFTEFKYPGAPEYVLETIGTEPFSINGVEIIPIRAMHYKLPVLGFRFGDLAYVTDANYIPRRGIREVERCQSIHHQYGEARQAHFALLSSRGDRSCQARRRRTAFLTHLSHQLPTHAELAAELPEGISPAYDGLTVEF